MKGSQMNKKKILLTTFISLLLSSCSKVPSSSPKSSDVTDYNSTKRLSESITAPQVGNTSTSESNEKEIKALIKRSRKSNRRR